MEQMNPPSDTVRRTLKSQEPEKQVQQSASSHSGTGVDVCFLMDITSSMQKYVDGTLKSLKELIKMVQSMLSKSVKFGFFGYRDFEEQNPGEKQFDYIDFDFYQYSNIEESALYKKINSIQCSGGGDFAEDIRGAILKNIEVMQWCGRQKYLVLIADAPAHGIRYNGGYGDKYPDATPLNDAIDLLIQKDIVLIILEISKYTKEMVNEISNYYKKLGRENLLEVNELKAEKIDDIAMKLSKCLCDTIKRNLDKETIKKTNY